VPERPERPERRGRRGRTPLKWDDAGTVPDASVDGAAGTVPDASVDGAAGTVPDASVDGAGGRCGGLRWTVPVDRAKSVDRAGRL
jgi:hypothetical protein